MPNYLRFIESLFITVWISQRIILDLFEERFQGILILRVGLQLVGHSHHERFNLKWNVINLVWEGVL